MRFRNQIPSEEAAAMPVDNYPRACGCYNEMPAMNMPHQGFQPSMAAQQPMAIQPSMPFQQSMPMQQSMPSQQPAVAPQPLPGFPTGFPTGGTTTPLLPASTGTPAAPLSDQIPTTLQSTLYTPGFLRTQIGRRMRVQFMIGTNTFTDRVGTLIAVGSSYILLRPVDSDDIEMCDIFGIKFVTILY